jgi:hypothetical protein
MGVDININVDVSHFSIDLDNDPRDMHSDEGVGRTWNNGY